jgi:hypothetical protein
MLSCVLLHLVDKLLLLYISHHVLNEYHYLVDTLSIQYLLAEKEDHKKNHALSDKQQRHFLFERFYRKHEQGEDQQGEFHRDYFDYCPHLFQG